MARPAIRASITDSGPQDMPLSLCRAGGEVSVAR
jgi:hypothetical protein